MHDQRTALLYQMVLYITHFTDLERLVYEGRCGSSFPCLQQNKTTGEDL